MAVHGWLKQSEWTVRVKRTSFSLDKTFTDFFTEFFIESYSADDLRFDSSWIKRYIATLVFYECAINLIAVHFLRVLPI